MAKQQANFLFKLRMVYTIMFVMAGFLVVYSFRWQLFDAERFAAEAAGRSADQRIPSVRGSIYASDGTTLAYSEPRYDVFIDIPELLLRETQEIQTRDEFVSKVAPLIDKTPEQLKIFIEEQYEQGIKYVKAQTSITVETRNKLNALKVDADEKLAENQRRKLTGVSLQETSKRIYPEGQLAAQVLGLTQQLDSGQTVGLGGIEGEWQELEPLEGVVSGERDARGNAIGISAERTIAAQRGNSIYTSIDKKLQQIIEDKLKWGVEAYSAKSGSIVIMDPKTGEIKAIANYPTYDPNLRETTDPEAYGNKAISEPYEIGSVGKIFTLTAAIDTNTVEPDSVILEGHEGCEKILDDLEPVCTHDKLPQPALPIKEAFARSDNIYFLHLAQKMPKELFYKYMINFGITRSSGVDIKGESTGVALTEPSRWNVSDQAAYSYGHSYQMTLLQATAAVGAVANYGVLMQPHVVTKVERPDGTSIEMDPTPLRQTNSRETTVLMDEMQFQIYKNNIFWSERHYNDLRNYKIAMKSGTALIQRNGVYTRDINATYSGYDASPDRSFVMLVRLERPQGSLASTNARVLWLETFRAFKDYLGVRRIGEF